MYYIHIPELTSLEGLGMVSVSVYGSGFAQALRHLLLQTNTKIRVPRGSLIPKSIPCQTLT